MTMEKLKVSEDVFIGLSDLFARTSEQYSKNNILRIHYGAVEEGDRWVGDRWEALNKLTMEQMAQAMFVGYEVALSPEEEVLEFYKELQYPASQEIVVKVLNKLGHKIEGINN